MSTTKCLLDGFPCLVSGSNGWTLTTGVIPHVRTFTLTLNHANLLRDRNAPVSLVISGDDAATTTFENLYIIGDLPGMNPHEGRVVVADRRYWWTYAAITRRYNIRRRVGFKRIAADNTRELTDVAPNLWYAPYSLPNGSRESPPWTATDALESIFQEAIQHEPGGSSSARIVKDGDLKFDVVPFENVEIQDNGADAIKRILAHMPDGQITLDEAGRVHLFSTASGAESQALRVEADGFGHLAMVSRNNIRPSEVHVLFQREVEVRVDFNEQTNRYADPNSIFAHNVMPYPDFAGTVDGQEVVRGTWVTFRDALDSWAGDPLPVFGALTIDDIRAAMVPFIDIWGLARLSGNASPDSDWGSRIGAIQTHFRRTFRINQRFMDRCLSWHAHRIGTVNPEDGSRAPAVVFTDWAMLPSQRFLQAAAKNAALPYIVNVAGFPVSDKIDSSVGAAPCRLVIADHDQGVFHLDWKIDQSRTWEMTFPSMIGIRGKGDPPAGELPKFPGPSGDITDRVSPLGFNCVTERGAIPELVRNYKMSAIVTMVPASPNNDDQMERVVVSPDDVASLLPEAMQEGLQKANGPILEIIIGGGSERARVRWNDDDKDAIYHILGIGNDDDPSRANPEVIRELTVNFDRDAQGAGSLQAIARAAAAAAYATYADRVVGSAAGKVIAGFYPRGRIESVEIAVGARGAVTTNVNVPDVIQSPSLLSLLPNSTRRILMRLANPGKA